jgi:hypothetical protein
MTRDELERMVAETNTGIDLLIARRNALEAENKALRAAAGKAEARGARDLLTYLHMSCSRWDDDTYGEIDDRGVARGTTTHTVVFDDGVLEEMMSLADISPQHGDYAIDRLRRESDRAEKEYNAEHSPKAPPEEAL